MPLYEMKTDEIVPIPPSSFERVGVKERFDLQRLLRERIETISPDTLIIAEEFGEWSSGSRRIDLLGVHRTGDIVVVELKRDTDGGHMELQALRYAAMASTMTFEDAVGIYTQYLKKQAEAHEDARERLTEFLHDPSKFGDNVRIVLAASGFNPEITSTVLWLRNYDVDISCVRVVPHQHEESTILQVERIIPLPEAGDYQVAVERKILANKWDARRREQERYVLKTALDDYQSLPRSEFMFFVVQEALRLGLAHTDIKAAVPWRSRKNLMLVSLPGRLSYAQFMHSARQNPESVGSVDLMADFFDGEDRVLHSEGWTHLLNRKWGKRTEEAARYILGRLPVGHGIRYDVVKLDIAC